RHGGITRVPLPGACLATRGGLRNKGPLPPNSAPWAGSSSASIAGTERGSKRGARRCDRQAEGVRFDGRRPRVSGATAETAPVAAPRARASSGLHRGSRSSVWAKMKRERWMYAFVLPGFIFFVVFRYLPLLGNIVAFEDYSPYLGFFESPWVGFDNFVALFNNPAVGSALANTLIINGLQILFYFPATISLALLLNSLIHPGAKRVVQSIVYLPYFIGWVVLVRVWQSVLGGDGLLY